MQHKIPTPFTYHPGLALALGNVNAAVLLSYLLTQDNDLLAQQGVHKTVDELASATGLSYEAQRTARRRLRAIGLLIESVKRLEHKIFYRIDRRALRRFLPDGTTLAQSILNSDINASHASSGNGESPSRQISPDRSQNERQTIPQQARQDPSGTSARTQPAPLNRNPSRFEEFRLGGAPSLNARILIASRMPSHTCVDWRTLLLQLGMSGYSTTTIERLIGISHGTLMGWKNNDVQPSHPKGERLIAFWSMALNRPREALPMRPVTLSRARIKG